MQAVHELSSPVGHGKAQEVGNKIGLELVELQRGESKEPECHLLFVVAAVWRAGVDPKGGDLVLGGIFSEGSQSPL